MYTRYLGLSHNLQVTAHRATEVTTIRRITLWVPTNQSIHLLDSRLIGYIRWAADFRLLLPSGVSLIAVLTGILPFLCDGFFRDSRCAREDSPLWPGFCSGDFPRFRAKRASISGLRLGPMSFTWNGFSAVWHTNSFVACPLSRSTLLPFTCNIHVAKKMLGVAPDDQITKLEEKGSLPTGEGQRMFWQPHILVCH